VLLALTTNQELGLAITAAVFIAFALLSALVIPRNRPDFPGRRGLVPFILVTVILTIAMLGAVEVFAKEEHPAAEGAEETTETQTTGTTETETTETETTGTTETATTETETTETETTGTTTAEEPAGDAAAGRAVFEGQGCGSCHTFAPAGATGTVGPNLDEVLAGKDAAFINESIVEPNAEVASGFSAGVMPQNYRDQLSQQQLDDLVAFLQSG
jgi:mono/diheme cytochrome c family protein